MTLKRYIILSIFIIPTLILRAQNYGNIQFIENKGQWNSNIQFKGDVSNGAFFIRKGGITILQNNKEDLARVYEALHRNKPERQSSNSISPSIMLRGHAYNVDFLGASADMKIIPDKPIPTYNNYFIGKDPSKWAGGCRIYQGITIQNIYPNVDVRYFTDKGTLKYDIIVNPGADIKKIALRYEGADKLQIKNKELVVSTSVGDLHESSPYTYQTDEKGRKEVSCKYVLKNNVVRFDVKDYDPGSTLVIDPTLIFCSFTGSQADNWGFTATYGPDGSMYGGGIVFDNGFPVNSGAFQTTFKGGGSDPFQIGFDIGIIKLTPDGSNRVYATYLGGTNNEMPASLIVDNQGELIVSGRSNSSDYPVFPNNNIGIPNPADNVSSGWNIIVTKFNSAGTALIGSKKIGGTDMDGANISSGSAGVSSLNRNYGDEMRSEVELDGAGNVYVASCTQSSDFPVTANAFQSTSGGFQDGVILKFDPNVSTLLFSSYLGGDGNDAAYVLAFNPTDGNLYVAGGTASNTFPGNKAGTIGSSKTGIIDGFVAVISGSSLVRSTYIGASENTAYNQIYGIQFDKNGFPYIMGQTTGTWPHVNAAYYNAGAKQFISKLQPDLSAYVYSTVFGTSASLPNISPVAFLVDRCENVYVSGWGGPIFQSSPTYYPSAGTGGMPITPDAIQSTTDGRDFYFFVLKKDAASQLYGSYFGKFGTEIGDHVDGGTSRFDRNGVIYQGICGDCEQGSGAFPTTPGAWSTVKPASALCNLALVKIAFNLAGVAAGVQSSINGVVKDSAGCVPLQVDFSDTVRNAVSYEWNFGDGTPTVSGTSPTISHTYNSTGTFLVMLVAIDPNSCNVRDTSYMHVRVGSIQALLNFNPVKLNPCDSFKYQFDNLSTSNPFRAFGAQSFTWDFGDGSAKIQAGTNSVTHGYAGPGTYNVKLVLTDTAYCNAPDSMTVQLRVAAIVKAAFTTPPTGCVPYNAAFNNTSVGGQTFQWDFGDGTTSNAVSPTHLYNAAGAYTITLIANDPNTCNLTDTTRFTINVYDKPVAAFTFSPDPPVENTPTKFDNNSSPDAVSFKWDFGDGDTLLTSSRLEIQHQFNATGTFNVCLTAYNAAGCPDSVCQPVRALINPVVDVPNAFTPLSGDINSVVMVRGFGIAKMRFIIWNRWGQKVFETNDRNIGWNGKYKGQLQPMDVYAYTLDVEFFDGTKITKKGDITLIR